jgi:hypothetical protein
MASVSCAIGTDDGGEIVEWANDLCAQIVEKIRDASDLKGEYRLF